MPADEVARGTHVDESRARTGPRHAAPRKPLFTRFHVPAGKAIAMAAMPTAVLMGMGFTPTLALADDHPSSKSLSVDEYKDCVTALEDASASPSASASDDASASATPSPSASASDDASSDGKDASGSGKSSGSKDAAGGSASDSGSGSGAADPAPSASATPDAAEDTPSDDATAAPSASASPSKSAGNVLENLGDAITDLFTGGKGTATESATPTPEPSASASASADKGAESSSDKGTDKAADTAGDAAKDSAAAATKAAGDAAKDTTDAATKAAGEATEAAKDATESATPTPSASASASTDPDDCPAATDADDSGIDNKVTLPDDPWYLNASSLLLTGADYQGVVSVRTADGSVKKVLKYVISDGTDIGDLKQTVLDKQQDKTYHVEGAKGSTSTIRDGQTVMYTQSISGNLFGLIPVTFDVDSPPPLNIPLIYFTNVKVVQAGQFGGTLHIPGLNQYVTDGTAG
ncbi:hypothetical protein [Streptomyces sp. NPDC008150]|uniref:hypothetical protein n=1 Tax=Streptomyces sp. NPDC008150 TaxID=3364816 RepID=UPI0036ED3E47